MKNNLHNIERINPFRLDFQTFHSEELNSSIFEQEFLPDQSFDLID